MGRRTSRRVVVSLLGLGTGLGYAGCASDDLAERAAVEPPVLERAGSAEAPVIGAMAGGSAPLGETIPGLHNVFAVVPGVFSGSGPESEEAFDSLAAMGVRTVISVDGARPGVELAHARGMRYVHVPIGYDGMEPDQALELAAAVRSLPGPVYIHCHHGKHRGPTGAAVALVGLGRMTNAQAVEFMRAAGTAESYPGLWACARETRPFSEADFASAPAEFAEVRTVSGLVDGMVAIDKSWERVKLVRAAGWAAPADHPDIAPGAEAGILADHFRALTKDGESLAEGEEFLGAMGLAMERAGALESSLTSVGVSPEAAERAYRAVASSCTDCHERWRN